MDTTTLLIIIVVLLLSPPVSQRSSFLPQRHDPTWPAFDGLLEKQPPPPITGERDELLDVAILVVPKLDGIWKIVRPPHSHAAMGERKRNRVKRASRYRHAGR